MNDAGQGLCLAMEDAVVLAWHLRRQGFTPQALRRSDMFSQRQGLSAQALHKPDTLVMTNCVQAGTSRTACVFLLPIVSFGINADNCGAFTEMTQASMGFMHNALKAKVHTRYASWQRLRA